MHKKHSQEPPSSEQPTKVKQILNWLSDFITTVPLVGLCLAPLYLVTGEPVVGFLLAVSLIMYLIAGMVYLLTSMKIYGWLVRVEVSVDIGVMLGLTVLGLATVANLLGLSLLCMS